MDANNLAGFPLAESADSEIKQSGAVCEWEIKHEPQISDGCVHFDDRRVDARQGPELSAPPKDP